MVENKMMQNKQTNKKTVVKDIIFASVTQKNSSHGEQLQLYLGCDTSCYQYKLVNLTMEYRPAENDFEVLVDGNLDLRQ